MPLPAALNPLRSLRARFALVMGGSGLAFALAATLWLQGDQRAELADTVGQGMRREALLLSRSLNVALHEQLRLLHQTASTPELSSGLMEPGDTRLLLEQLRAQNPALAWLGVTDAAGRVQVASNALLEGQTLDDPAWLQASLQGPWVGRRRPAGRLAAHLGLDAGGQAPALIDLGTPLIDFQGRTLGVLAARVRWDWLDALHQSMLTPDRRLPGSQTLVLDRDGRVLLGPAAQRGQALQVPGLAPLGSQARAQLLDWPGEGRFLTALGRDDSVATAPSAGAPAAGGGGGAGGAGGAGLTVLVRQPAALAFAGADALRQRLLAYGLLATLGFMALSIWLAGRVARPVKALSAAAAAASAGAQADFVVVPARRQDEVAQLAHLLQALQAELARRLAQLAQTSRMAHVGGWSLDIASQRATWTDEMARIYELPPDTMPTRDLAMAYFRGDDHARLDAAVRRAVRDGEPYDLELQLHMPDGRRKWVRALGRAVRDNGRTVRLEGITQDITDRRAAEEAVRDLNAQLEQRVADRTAQLLAANAELDSFAYAVSHDLRAPLRAMSGFSEALVEDYGPQLDATARSYLDQISLASRHMGELIDGLLVLSRSTRGLLQLDDVDVTALAERAVAELRRAEPGRQVQVDISPGLRARGDHRMVDAVLRNLIGNAWKYSARNPAARIQVSQRQLDGHTWTEVADNGAGFDMAHAGRLFKAFARLHRQDEFPGLGIGLATVQRIVNRHGGRIEADSAPGQGARFRFTLPDNLHDNRAPEPEEPTPS